MTVNLLLSSPPAWHRLNFHVSCYFSSPWVAHIPGACPCGISLPLCRHPEHIFSVTGVVPEAVLRSSTRWLEPPGHSGHRGAANQRTALGFLSSSGCREMIHENTTKKNPKSLAKLSLASDTLQGWVCSLCVLHTAHVSTVRTELEICGGTAWII